ncbi:MAG: ABC transporter permease subunit [Clostridia bacterium]|nr:ABC transporter permease subunit [Clostridia bacterium]MBR6744724.1 ABC transporter permease subunit [Clostridia bacterium]
MLAIFKREMRSYFTSPVGYMFCAIFFAVSGFLFMLNTVQAGENANYAGYFSIILFLFIVIIPLLTMKLVSEETKMKTDQLLMTAPITLADIVFGKYLAALTMFGGSFIVSSAIYYIPLAMYGTPNLALYIGCVLGVFLVGSAFISIGIFISSLTENQFISAFGTIGAIIFLLFVSSLNSYINNEAVRNFLSGLSITSRYSYFSYGLFSYDSLIYFISLSAVFLFLTIRVFEKRRWSKS